MINSQLKLASVEPDLVDVVFDQHDGYPEHFEAEDTRDALMDCCGSATRSFPSEYWIEPKDWAAKARENDENKTWGTNYVDTFTNQPPTHECTSHSLTRIFCGARNRQIGMKYPDGPKKDFRYAESGEVGSVFISPLSVYAEANPSQWGGASIRSVLEIACRRGFLPDKIQPRDYGFKHVLHGTAGKGNSNQSSGPFLRVSQFPDGWEETAKLFKPEEVVFPEAFEQTVCCLLHGVLIGVGRSGHAVPWSHLVFNGNNLEGAAYIDSYNIMRFDSVRVMKSAWRGCFGILTTSPPDDWMNPAK